MFQKRQHIQAMLRFAVFHLVKKIMYTENLKPFIDRMPRMLKWLHTVDSILFFDTELPDLPTSDESAHTQI